MTSKKRTPTQTKQMQDLFTVITDLMSDFAHPELVPGHLPPQWRHLDMTPVPEKTRVTIRLDKDVAKFFRGLGPGYQTRVNLVLRAFMLAYLSDTLGRVSDDVKVVPEAELTEDERHDLEMERRYVQMVKDVRERRVRGKMPKRRWDD